MLDGDVLVTANDDKLDTVAWVPFADERHSKLVVFAQCKTGTNWQGYTTQLQPLNFIKKWCNESFTLDPIVAFFCAESPNRTTWKSTCVSAGLLFDRCRIVSHASQADVGDINKWYTTAKQSFRLVS